MKLLILIFDWNEKALIIIQVQIMKIEWKLYLEMRRKFSQVSIPSIEKKISERVRNYSHLNYSTYFDIHCISKVL